MRSQVSMKILGLFTLPVLSICVVMIAFRVTNGQIPSELIRMGLNGRVRTIKLEIRTYNWEDSRWESAGDPVNGLTRYNRNGRCLTPHIDPGSGWRPYGVPLPPVTASRSHRYEIVRKPRNGMGWKTVWQFDNEGRLGRFEAYGLYESGPVLSNWQQYSYNSQGRVTEFTYWADWGWSPRQTEPYPPVRIKYWFDDAGRIGRWTDLDNPENRSTLSYDAKGRLVKQVDEKQDGNVTYVTTLTWDGYDQQGNWTVQTRTEMWRTEDGEDPHGQTVIRRSLTYWQRTK